MLRRGTWAPRSQADERLSRLLLQDVYTFATGSWARNVTTSSVTRCDHCAMWANGKMYVVGGFDTSYNTLDTVEVFDPATGRFTVNPAMKLPAPRGDVGCNAVGSVLYVHGGYYDPTGVFAGGNHHNTTFAYDLSNPAAGWVRKADMNWARGDHAFSVLSGGRLLVAGGESNPFTTDNKTPIRGVEIYDPVGTEPVRVLGAEGIICEAAISLALVFVGHAGADRWLFSLCCVCRGRLVREGAARLRPLPLQRGRRVLPHDGRQHRLCLRRPPAVHEVYDGPLHRDDA